jgi:uncharacterized protein (TIGR02996 family)
MNTESALLAAVRIDPDEDAPRLVYADWLDENADALTGSAPAAARARAEFIRLQIAFEGRDSDPDFEVARERAEALRTRYQPLWIQSLPTINAYWEYRRGFPELARTDLARFPSVAEHLFAVAPVRGLGGSLDPKSAEALANCPHLQRIRQLDLRAGEGLTEDHIRRLFTSPHTAGLRELKIAWFTGLSARATELLASSESLAGLESLSFWQDQFTPEAALALAGSKSVRLRRLNAWIGNCDDAGMRALAESPAVERLEWLTLRAGHISAAGATALAESPYLGPLWHLELGGNQIGTEGVTALARCPRLSGVRVLGLDMARAGRDGLSALARSEHLLNLRRLELMWNYFRAGTMKVFADAPAFAQLQILNLHGNGLGDGAAHIANAPHLKRLERLDLSSCSIKDAGGKALAESENFPALTHLTLSRNRIGDATALALADSRVFPDLRLLALNNNAIGDAGAIALARSAQMETVEALGLRSNKIGDAGAKALLESPHFGRLKQLDFGRNKVSRAVQTALEKRFAHPA